MDQGIFAVVWQWWLDPELLKTFHRLFTSRGTHAGAGETSMIWFINERLLEQSALEQAAQGASEVFGVAKFGTHLPLDTVDFSKSGATLNPREASRKAGEVIFNTAKAQLANLICWLEAAPVEELRQKPHVP